MPVNLGYKAAFPLEWFHTSVKEEFGINADFFFFFWLEKCPPCVLYLVSLFPFPSEDGC